MADLMDQFNSDPKENEGAQFNELGYECFIHHILRT